MASSVRRTSEISQKLISDIIIKWEGGAGSLLSFLIFIKFLIQYRYVGNINVRRTFEIIQTSNPINDKSGSEQLGIGDQLFSGVVLELGVVPEGCLALYPADLVTL